MNHHETDSDSSDDRPLPAQLGAAFATRANQAPAPVAFVNRDTGTSDDSFNISFDGPTTPTRSFEPSNVSRAQSAFDVMPTTNGLNDSGLSTEELSPARAPVARSTVPRGIG